MLSSYLLKIFIPAFFCFYMIILYYSIKMTMYLIEC